MSTIAFFDLEVTQQGKERIASIGSLFRGEAWHRRSVQELEEFTKEAQYLCGHNIFAHDLPYLQRAGASAAFLDRPFIDTLYLSTLLFPCRPYHKLVKDYRLHSEHLNDPVADSRLA